MDSSRSMPPSLPGVSADGSAAHAAPPEPASGPKLAEACPCGRFLILRRHAEGGLGTVSIAVDGTLHRRVALKQMRPELADDPVARLRFIREVRITGQLEHPAIVPVYAFGQDEDARPYYAMRFVEGPTLDEAIAAHCANPDAVGFNDLLRRFVDLCRAVAYAHSQGVIHRDLKPQNVVVGMYGETILLDWGLAKQLGDAAKPASADPGLNAGHSPANALNSDANPVGTPAYMAPEQAGGQATTAGTAADIYSLARSFTRFSRASRHTPPITRAIFSTASPWPRRPRPRPCAEPSRALEAICLKAMSRQPADRYQHADYIATDIDRFLAGQPVDVYPESLLERASRWRRPTRRSSSWASSPWCWP